MMRAKTFYVGFMMLLLGVVGLPGVTRAQLSVAFHASTHTAVAMQKDQVPEQPGSIANTSAEAWLNVVAINQDQPFSFSGQSLVSPNGQPSGATLSGRVGLVSAVENELGRGQ
jgi:hypothetical protein